MKRHLRKYAWLYGLILALIVWPWLILSANTLPTPDPQLVADLIAWHDEYLQKTYGEFRPIEWGALQNQIGAIKFAEVPRFRRYLNPTRPDLLSTTAAAPDRQALEALLRPYLERWDALAADSLFCVPAGELPDWRNGANYFSLQQLAYFRRASAQAAILKKDWDAALAELAALGRMSDPIRHTHAIGSLIATAVRGIAYGGYAALLSADPPAEVCRRAVADLSALQACESYEPTVLRIQESLPLLLNQLESTLRADTSRKRNWRQRKGESFAIRHLALQMAAGGLIEERENLRDPGTRRWAERLARRTRQPTPSRDPELTTLQWTFAPAAWRALETVYRQQPELARLEGLPAELSDRLDAGTRLILSGNMEPHWRVLQLRLRIAATSGRVVQAGLAARLFELEMGRPPASIEELIPGYLPEEATGERLLAPLPELHLAEMPLDDAIIEAVWREDLPLGLWRPEFLWSGTQASVKVDNGRVSWRAFHDVHWGGQGISLLEQPILVMALAKALLAHPALVESVTVEVWQGPPRSRISPRARPDGRPLTVEEARRITDETDAQVEERSVPVPDGISFAAQLRRPARILAIWSDGPDGKDDGGKLFYEPTNGITSSGDIVRFLVR